MPRSIECFMAANQAIKKSTFCLPVSTIIYPYLSISFHIYEVNRLDQRSIAILLMYLKYYDFIICMHELGNAWANCPVKPSDPKASKSWMLPFKDWNQWVLNLHKNDVYPCVSMYIHVYPWHPLNKFWSAISTHCWAAAKCKISQFSAATKSA